MERRGSSQDCDDSHHGHGNANYLVNYHDMSEEERRTWHFNSLKWCLQALAAPADAQVSLFPDFVCVTDELGLDFEHWHLVVLGNYGAKLSDEQRGSLAILDARLTSIGGTGPEFSRELWSEIGLRNDDRWDEVRILAGNALDAFGWPRALPPTDPEARGVAYVPG